MRRRICALAVVVSFVALAGRATAGPIGWSYTATAETSYHTLMMNLGSRVLADPATGEMVRHYYYGQMQFPNPTGTAEGNSRLRLVGFGIGDIQDRLTPNPLIYSDDINVTLTLRDAASGETGQLATHTSVGFSMFQADGTPYYPYMGFSLSDQQLVLGANRYLVDYRVDQNGSEAWFVAEVRVKPASETPEPATLALAGLGLASAFGLRLRRRFVAR
jgi:hypothetical protein